MGFLSTKSERLASWIDYAVECFESSFGMLDQEGSYFACGLIRCNPRLGQVRTLSTDSGDITQYCGDGDFEALPPSRTPSGHLEHLRACIHPDVYGGGARPPEIFAYLYIPGEVWCPTSDGQPATAGQRSPHREDVSTGPSSSQPAVGD